MKAGDPNTRGYVKRNGKQTGIVLPAAPSHTFRLLSPLVPGARSSWINNLYRLDSSLSVGQNWSPPVGDREPCLPSSGGLGLVRSRNSCQVQKGFWRLSSRDRVNLEGFWAGLAQPALSSAIRGVLMLSICEFELVCKLSSLLLSQLPSIVWPDAVRWLSRGRTGMWPSGKLEDKAKMSSSWVWGFPKEWKIRNKNKKSFRLIGKGMLEVWGGVGRSTYLFLRDRKEVPSLLFTLSTPVFSWTLVKRTRSDLSGDSTPRVCRWVLIIRIIETKSGLRNANRVEILIGNEVQLYDRPVPANSNMYITQPRDFPCLEINEILVFLFLYVYIFFEINLLIKKIYKKLF